MDSMGPFYQPIMVDYGEFYEMVIGRGKSKVLGEKYTTLPLHPPLQELP
jgi:hypothetical protein